MSNITAIYNWRRLNHRVTTSGQPSERQLADLAALGVAHVVNLGLHSHERALPDEAASVAALGMTYTHIPVDFDRPTSEDFAAFCGTMTRLRDEPVHIHCIANMRVSAFLYRWHRDVARSGVEQAKALMNSVWRPGSVWATFIGDEASSSLPHRPPE